MSGRRRFAPRALTPGLLLSVLACSSDRPPDVILISLDSVRADALTFRDPEVAPNLTRLAEEGTVFTQAISGSSWTLPAHAQMFTGQPPVLHGVQYDDVSIDPRTPTLPHLLAEHGWFTAGFWTGWYLAGEYGFERGFDVYENAMTRGDELEREYKRAVAQGAVADAQRVLAGRDVLSHQDITSPGVVERVRRTLERADPARPLFLFAHFFDPHYDYVPPAPWNTRFDPDYRGSYDGRNFYNNRKIFDGEKRRIPDRDLRHIVSLYQGEIGWTDAALGQLFALLDDHDRLDEAIVVVVGDHGDEFFEHAARGHRHSLFEELIHVPLLVRLPASMQAGAVSDSDALVSLSDLAPTVLAAAGIPVPGSMEGRSLLPLVRGGSRPERPVVSSLSLRSGEDGGRGITHVYDSIRLDELKLIRFLRVAPGEERPRTAGTVWYDLEADPKERTPLNDPTHPRVRGLTRRLDDELVRLRERWDALDRSPDHERATRIREVFAADLGALGYADGSTHDGEHSPSFDLPWGLAPHPPPATNANAGGE